MDADYAQPEVGDKNEVVTGRTTGRTAIMRSSIRHIENIEDGHHRDTSQRRWRNQKKSGRIAVAG
jgi:hypothetical protein